MPNKVRAGGERPSGQPCWLPPPPPRTCPRAPRYETRAHPDLQPLPFQPAEWLLQEAGESADAGCHGGQGHAVWKDPSDATHQGAGSHPKAPTWAKGLRVGTPAGHRAWKGQGSLRDGDTDAGPCCRAPSPKQQPGTRPGPPEGLRSLCSVAVLPAPGDSGTSVWPCRLQPALDQDASLGLLSSTWALLGSAVIRAP